MRHYIRYRTNNLYSVGTIMLSYQTNRTGGGLSAPLSPPGGYKSHIHSGGCLEEKYQPDCTWQPKGTQSGRVRSPKKSRLSKHHKGLWQPTSNTWLLVAISGNSLETESDFASHLLS
jgi:hypothetical protein